MRRVPRPELYVAALEPRSLAKRSMRAQATCPTARLASTGMADTELEVRERAPAPEAEPSQPTQRVDRVTVIRPAPRWPHLDFRELWQYRELLARLAWRDIAVRYKQTSIGVAWAILQPFLTMVVFTFVFGRFANFPSKGVPYPIFIYSALLPWTYFASSVALASSSLVSNRGLVTKVYFPRILLPLAGVDGADRRLRARPQSCCSE